LARSLASHSVHSVHSVTASIQNAFLTLEHGRPATELLGRCEGLRALDPR
jgi:hypothetical protein